MAEYKYLIVKGGGKIELANGNEASPFGGAFTIQEALSVYRLTYVHGEPLQIEEVKSRMGDTKFIGRGKHPDQLRHKGAGENFLGHLES